MKKNALKWFSNAVLAFCLSACASEVKNTQNEQNKLLGIPEIDAFTEKIAKNPSDTALHHARAKVALQLEEFPLALADAEFLVRADSSKVDYFRLLADVYYESKQIQPCMDVLELTAKKFPKDIYTKLSLAEMQLILSEYDKSLITLDEIAKISPYNSEAMFLRGIVLKDKGDTLQSLAAFQEVVQQNGEHLEAYLQLAELNMSKNNPLALQYLNNALRIDSNNLVALSKKSYYFHNLGQFKNALEWYEKSTVAHPLDADVAYNKGLLLLDESEKNKDNKLLQQAYNSFKLATKNDVQFGEAYYYRGFCAEKLGNLEEAKNDYENAVAMNEKFGYAKEALKRLNKNL
jgi:tetratricopeptide (TPR) repeat protein